MAEREREISEDERCEIRDVCEKLKVAINEVLRPYGKKILMEYEYDEKMLEKWK